MSEIETAGLLSVQKRSEVLPAQQTENFEVQNSDELHCELNGVHYMSSYHIFCVQEMENVVD
jgi:hypothetical protein